MVGQTQSKYVFEKSFSFLLPFIFFSLAFSFRRGRAFALLTPTTTTKRQSSTHCRLTTTSKGTTTSHQHYIAAPIIIDLRLPSSRHNSFFDDEKKKAIFQGTKTKANVTATMLLCLDDGQRWSNEKEEDVRSTVEFQAEMASFVLFCLILSRLDHELNCCQQNQHVFSPFCVHHLTFSLLLSSFLPFVLCGCVHSTLLIMDTI